MKLSVGGAEVVAWKLEAFFLFSCRIYIPDLLNSNLNHQSLL
jgi:hypothetical protein